MAKLTVNQFCQALKPAAKAEFGCPNMKPEEAAVITGKDKKSGAITAAATEIRAKRNTPAPAPEGNVQIEAGAGLNASNPDITDNSGGGAAVKQGGFGSRYQANDDFGGLTFAGSVVVTKPLSDTSKLRLGAKFNYTELNPYFDQYQDPMTPRLSRFAAMAVVGIEGKIAPNAFASADLLIGAVKTWAGEKDAKASFKTSDLAMATTKGTDLDKWALHGGLAARIGYNLSSRFYMALTGEVTVDSLSSDVKKNPESEKTFNVQTSGPTATVGATVGAKF